MEDGMFVIVNVAGTQIFASGIPLPPDYQIGKLLLVNVATDALAALERFKAEAQIEQLRKQLTALSTKEEGSGD